MKINKLIRSAVLADLESELQNQGINVNAFFSGMPAALAVPDENDDTSSSDLPAVAVSVGSGEFSDDDFNEEDWDAVLTVRIYTTTASSHIDDALDEIGQVVIDTIGPHYRAGGHIISCTKHSFQYGRDEILPWGTLDLNFAVNYTEEV